MSGIDFFVPSGKGEFELVEKRSRFLGEVWKISSEEEGKELLAGVRKKYHDASHHCWCYRMDEMLQRYSDDGEPQGTAGQPMLRVVEQGNVREVLCVVTRYFGKIELGTGGLVRAYTHCAQGALAAAGLSYYESLREVSIILEYSLLERVQAVVGEYSGLVMGTEYGADIEMLARLPVGKCEEFLLALTEVSAGQVLVEELGLVRSLVPYVSDKADNADV